MTLSIHCVDQESKDGDRDGTDQAIRDDAVGGKEEQFFTETDIYWVPASNTTELDNQLAKNKFREISRHHIE